MKSSISNVQSSNSFDAAMAAEALALLGSRNEAAVHACFYLKNGEWQLHLWFRWVETGQISICERPQGNWQERVVRRLAEHDDFVLSQKARFA